MAPNRTYPVSLLFEGPLFSDELKYKPQQSSIDQEFETLRLVPSKSAASGVYTIYFCPEHRQWALVRLAERYRGLFEIELHRGMSGEYQLLRQGFTSDDLDFLFDIVPKPAKEYSPVVYDMLWLVATYDEYFTLTEAMVDRDEFTPVRSSRQWIVKYTRMKDFSDDSFEVISYVLYRTILNMCEVGQTARKPRSRLT